MNFSIVLPVYNEQVTLPNILAKLKDFALNANVEVIIVNDASIDNSENIIKEYSNVDGFKVINHSHNKGYGAAIKTGVFSSKNEIILMMDADGQHSIEYVKPIIEALKENDLVIGERNRNKKVHFQRRVAKWFLKKTVELLVGKSIPDINSGFRAFRKSKFMEFITFYPNGFSITTTMTVAFYKAAYEISFIPINVNKRIGGYSEVRLLKDGIQTILLICRSIIVFNPLKVFVPIALFLFFMGALYGLWGVIWWLSFPKVAVLSILSAINIFFFGFLADQLSVIRREISKRK